MIAAVDGGGRWSTLYTSGNNVVAVATNGTAVLGLGNIGPLTGKPALKGKGCVFKRFGGRLMVDG